MDTGAQYKIPLRRELCSDVNVNRIGFACDECVVYFVHVRDLSALL